VESVADYDKLRAYNMKRKILSIQIILNKNTFYGTRYLSYCCSLYCCRDIKPQIAYIRVSTLTFRVTWRHRSRDRTIRYIWFPIGALLTLTQIRSIRSFHYFGPLAPFKTQKYEVTWLWPRPLFGNICQDHVGTRDYPWKHACQIWSSYL